MLKHKHLANNHKWAEHGANTENASTEPDVEEQQELWGKKKVMKNGEKIVLSQGQREKLKKYSRSEFACREDS